ncbi:MAG TPA: hypothetical protein VK943_18990 [Arenibaculum sp.]|nr:hypothetical protein [Arenibaculum sp.]
MNDAIAWLQRARRGRPGKPLLRRGGDALAAPARQKLLARQMEVYGGFWRTPTTEVGRLLDAARALGHVDDTIASA